MTAKNGDWWTGTIGDRSGVFPFNYVEPAPEVGHDKMFYFINVCTLYLVTKIVSLLLLLIVQTLTVWLHFLHPKHNVFIIDMLGKVVVVVIIFIIIFH